ncbi:hypothetical protein VAEKB19_5000001 [Vibrio aestuarianus]|nr:hypothetical protein VAEKB19_5000001 [Vibrio aestuarianus]
MSLAFSIEFFANYHAQEWGISSVISSLPSAFRGLGFNFTAVRFTLPFESNNVFQIRHFGVIRWRKCSS